MSLQDTEKKLLNTIGIPEPDKWSEEYEVHVIDKKTGKVVSKLDQIAELKLFDDIHLRVKASELDLLKKETANIKKLTKEQSDDFKKFISEVGSNRPLSRKEITTFIKEIQKEKKKTQKYRQAGHHIDQKLSYQKPEVQYKVEESHIEVKVEGIRLTEPLSKMDHALTKLLRDNSQNHDPYAKDYYQGNKDSLVTDYGGEKRRVPVVKFKRPDLYRAYLCRDDYSGADAKYIDGIFMQYASKKFLIKYDRVKQVNNGSKTQTLTDRIEEFQSLIKVLYFFPNLTDDEKAKLDNGCPELREKREEVIVAYSPIFIDQINTKFVEFPDDTNRRFVIAAGGHKQVTPAMRRLMEWCLREISAGRQKQEINEENLALTLALEKYIQEKRNKIVGESIKKAIDAVKNMGIILEAEKAKNSKGRIKWLLTFNAKYE
ncbi:hypothetical protein JST56_07760 [Candidatus Dependentiae bacterium]|nr:hypothetical protein [Candidatus Dependentiae bacterium]